MEPTKDIRIDLDSPEYLSVIDDLPLWSAPFGLKLLDTIKLNQNTKALDIGSGAGFPIVEMAQRLGNSSDVYGIDPWQAAVDRINLKIKLWQISNLKIITGKAEKLPFDDEFFNLVTSNNGINNVEDDQKVMLEIDRVCRKGAQLVFTVNLPESMHEFYQIYESVLNKHRKTTEIEKMHDHIYEKRKPLNYTLDLIRSAGFAIQNVFEDSFKLRFADGTTMRNHFFIKLAFWESWVSILSPDDIPVIFDEIETELNHLAHEQGDLGLSIPWVCIDAVKK